MFRCNMCKNTECFQRYRNREPHNKDCFEFDPETDDMYFRWEEYVICPECGYHFKNDYTRENCFYEPGEFDTECPNCEKEFTVLVEMNPSYSTSKKEVSTNG